MIFVGVPQRLDQLILFDCRKSFSFLLQLVLLINLSNSSAQFTGPKWIITRSQPANTSNFRPSQIILF